MSDKIGFLRNSTIHYGAYNDRVYLMKLNEKDNSVIVNDLVVFARKKSYSKIFAKVLENSKSVFLNSNFTIEASIPDFFKNETCYFMSYFLNNERKIEKDKNTVNNVIATAKKKREKIFNIGELSSDFSCHCLSCKDVDEMVEIYKVVFDTYPFPIYNPEYLKEIMESHVKFFGIRKGNKLIALSSAECDHESKTVEMTDFATLPEFRGSGLALYLLDKMENEMKSEGYRMSFTIARAISFGMNITFAKCGYDFGGTLVNNTNISGKIESMNVWYKNL